MKPALAIALAVTLGASLPARSEQTQDFSKVQIKAVKVAGNVYVLYGAGGNIALSVGDDGVVMVDDQFAPLAPKIKEAIAGITKKPMRFILNTHWHSDHTGGNEIFERGGATIVAHDNVRKRLVAGATIMGNKVPPAPKDALPILTFDDTATLHLNGEDIRAVHVPAGHTDGDSIIYFTKSNVVHLGDDFFQNGFPFIDLASGGSVKGLIDVLNKLIPTLPADAKLIPGHGEVANLEALKAFTKNIEDIYAAVSSGVGQRKSLEQLKKEKAFSKWASMGRAFVSEDLFLEIVYADITQGPKAKAP
jgi:cyclase